MVGGATGIRAGAVARGRVGTRLLDLVQLPPERRLGGAAEGARGREPTRIRVDHRRRRLADAGYQSRLRVTRATGSRNA